MMQAGKDYITKSAQESEAPRAAYLRELLQAVKPQVDASDEKAADAPEVTLAKSPNQAKPTLKLTK